MMRWDVINYFIQKNNYNNFLEIGYYKGWNVERVNCKNKKSVDPAPCRYPEQGKALYGDSLFDKESNAIVEKLSSDDFFKKYDHYSLSPLYKYDIIFIDGLHEASQVYRDIQNSLKHLSEGGVIILHDCNAPLESQTKGGDEHGNWTGDCYRAIIELRSRPFLPYNYRTIDTDWGVGVIGPVCNNGFVADKINKSYERIDWERAKIDWNYFDQNRKEILNLISVEEFLQEASYEPHSNTKTTDR